MRTTNHIVRLISVSVTASAMLTACATKEDKQDRATKDCEALLVAQEPSSVPGGERRFTEGERFIKIKRGYKRTSLGGDRQQKRDYFCDWRTASGEVTYLMTQGQSGGDNGDQNIRLPQREWDAAVKRHNANKTETSVR